LEKPKQVLLLHPHWQRRSYLFTEKHTGEKVYKNFGKGLPEKKK